MKKWIIMLSLAAFSGLASCNNDAKLNGVIAVESEFETTAEGWQGGFAGYASATPDTILDLTSERARLPAILDSTRYGFKTEGNNSSDVMFMFVKKKITGLRPGTTYSVTFNMTIGTQYTDKTAGTSPGNNTFIKAGASASEPIVTLLGSGIYTINLNKGNLAEGGNQMAAMGNISNGLDGNEYRLVTRSNGDNPVTVTANTNGEVWLCVGTDSGYKGLATLYYDRIRAELTMQN